MIDANFFLIVLVIGMWQERVNFGINSESDLGWDTKMRTIYLTGPHTYQKKYTEKNLSFSNLSCAEHMSEYLFWKLNLS